MSVASNAVNRKRKKTESKPQSQLNKCLNEKRRREQENIYIEELAELISASASDMSSLSVKPDKCAILQETVNQIRRIKQHEPGQSDELQQSEVSSSKPTILANDIYGPLLLEALDGFLFVVNIDGKIEFVSDNVTSFLNYTHDDIVDKSIYNVIHVGDRARFSSSLLPMMSLGNGSVSTPESSSSGSKSRSFNCRFLIKPDSLEDNMEEKQSSVTRYENMQVSSVFFPFSTETNENSENRTDAQNHLACVARRIPPNEKSPTSLGVEQFTTRLNLTGKIIAIDTSGISSTYSQFLSKDLVGCIIHELCHPSDLQKLNFHLKETLRLGSNTSGMYRLRVGQDRYVPVQTKSKQFVADQSATGEEFIMSTHSIIRDCDNPSTVALENNPKRIPSPSNLGSASNSSSISIVNSLNGGVSVTSASMQSSFAGFQSQSPGNHEIGFNDMNDIFISPSWALDQDTESKDSDKLLSFAISSPQPASVSGRALGRGTSSQVLNRALSPGLLISKSNCSNPSPTAPGHAPTPYSGNSSSLRFSPTPGQSVGCKTSPSASSIKSDGLNDTSGLDVTSGLPHFVHEGTTNSQANQRLRNLLTQNVDEVNRSMSKGTPSDECDVLNPNLHASESNSHISRPGVVEDVSQSSTSENIILRELLNQDDEDMKESLPNISIGPADNKMAHLMLTSGSLKSESENLKRFGNNNMLRKLLNNSDDINRNYSKPQDLIQHLLKGNASDTHNDKSARDRILQSSHSSEISVPKQMVPDVNRTSPSISLLGESAPQKRKSMDTSSSTSSVAKRPNPVAHNTHLAGQNPMLASMLAQTPRTPPSVPTSIANSIMSQLPQERLPKNLEKKLVHTPYTMTSTSSTTTGSQVLTAQSTLGRTVFPTSSIQQDVVTSDSRGHVTQHTLRNLSSGVNRTIYSQPQQGFLNKILNAGDGSHISRSVSVNISQHSLQNANLMQQFNSTGTETFNPSRRVLKDMLCEGTSTDQVPVDANQNDAALNEILDQLWSLEEDLKGAATTTAVGENSTLLKLLEDVCEAPAIAFSPSGPSGGLNINEKIAISAIQKHLMSYEDPSSVANPGESAPHSSLASAYSQSGQTNLTVNRPSPQSQLPATSAANFSMHPTGSQPPAYSSSGTATRIRLPVTVSAGSILANSQQILGLAAIQRAGLPQHTSLGGSSVTNPTQVKKSLTERRQKLYLQQQQKRLLEQQQKQQMTMQTQQPLDVINSSGSSGFPENMNDLLNNTIAPNVTLQRSSSVPPEPQLSPCYSANVIPRQPSPVTQSTNSSQLSPNQRVNRQSPFSPLSQQTFSSIASSAHNFQQRSSQSPHPLPSYPHGGTSHSLSPVPSGVGSDSRSPHLQLSPQQGSGPPQWNQRPSSSPLQNNLQQQNPMLNAQLSQASFNNGQQRLAAQQRPMQIRSLPSPGAVQNSRNSPFTGQSDVSYPPLSPLGSYKGQQQQQQQQRLQRTVSGPGRVNSSRTSGHSAYVGSEPVLSPQSQQSPGFSQSVPSTPITNYVPASGHSNQAFNLQESSTHFPFDQQNLQIFTSSAAERSRIGNSAQVSSDFVRQELRAVVDARTQHHRQQQQSQGNVDLNSMSLGSTTSIASVGHSLNIQFLNREALEELGFSVESTPGDHQDTSQSLYSPSLLSIASGSENHSSRGRTSSPRVEESKPVDQKKSLLQQLLSEPT